MVSKTDLLPGSAHLRVVFPPYTKTGAVIRQKLTLMSRLHPGPIKLEFQKYGLGIASV